MLAAEIIHAPLQLLRGILFFLFVRRNNSLGKFSRVREFTIIGLTIGAASEFLGRFLMFNGDNCLL